MSCPGLPSVNGFLWEVLNNVDCRARTLGEEGYRALVSPGSSFTMIVTGLLTIFVAVYGYRLLMGGAVSLQSGMLAMVKIGIVLTFTLSWPAYRTLVYDVVLHGPAELVAAIGQPAGLPGASGGLTTRLELTDRALTALAVAGPGEPAANQPNPFAAFNTYAIGGARVTYLVSTIASLGLVRGVAGLLLALGPLFIALLLFAGTRGLLEGWVRVMIGAAIGAIGVTILLGVQIALLDPWLTDLLARRAAREAIPSAPVALLALNLSFGLALAGMLFASFRLAYGFHLPSSLAAILPAGEGRDRPIEGRRTSGDPLARPGDVPPVAERSRAAVVAEAVQASQRREEQATAPPAGPGPGARTGAGALATANTVPTAETVRPFGQSARRRTGTRVSAGAARRDIRS